MSMSEIFSGLDEIDFTVKDPDTITEEVISKYELLTGRSLARSDPVRLFLNAIILEFVQQRNEIDRAAKMNLIAYATGSYLDHIGALYGVTRLSASNAICTIEFTLSAPLTHNIDIPIGTRVTPDGRIYFETTELIRILAGQTTSRCICMCSTSGTIGNDYVAGQISRIVDPFPYEMSAMNIDTSSGGTDTESDEAFRERIHIAPESFSTAGSRQGYKYYALGANSNISDVSVLTANEDASIPPGNVYIYVLMHDGAIPTDDVLQQVLDACSAEDVRPDTDYVHVFAPEQVKYNIELRYWIDRENAAQSETIQQQVEAAITAWCKWERSALGRDINPTKLIHDIAAAGAKRCEIISPPYESINDSQVASNLPPIIIGFAGLD